MSFLSKLGNLATDLALPAISVGASALAGGGNPFVGEALKKTLLTMGTAGLGSFARGKEEERMRKAQRQAQQNQARANLINVINPSARAQARPVEMPKAGLLEKGARALPYGLDVYQKAQMAQMQADEMKNRILAQETLREQTLGKAFGQSDFVGSDGTLRTPINEGPTVIGVGARPIKQGPTRTSPLLGITSNVHDPSNLPFNLAKPIAPIGIGAGGASRGTTSPSPVKPVPDVYPGGAPVRSSQDASSAGLEEMGFDVDRIYAQAGIDAPPPREGSIVTSLGRQIGGPALTPEELKQHNHQNRWRDQMRQLRGHPASEVGSPEWNKLRAGRMEQWGWDGNMDPIIPASTQEAVGSAPPGASEALPASLPSITGGSDAAFLQGDIPAGWGPGGARGLSTGESDYAKDFQTQAGDDLLAAVALQAAPEGVPSQGEPPSYVDPFRQRPINIPADASLTRGEPSSTGLQVKPYKRRATRAIENPFDQETRPIAHAAYAAAIHQMRMDEDVAARAERALDYQERRLIADEMAAAAEAKQADMEVKAAGDLRSNEFYTGHLDAIGEMDEIEKLTSNSANLVSSVSAIKEMIARTNLGEEDPNYLKGISGNVQGMMLRVIQRVVDDAQVTEKDLATTQALQGKWRALKLKFKDWTGTQKPEMIGNDEIEDMVYFLERSHEAVQNTARESIAAYTTGLRRRKFGALGIKNLAALIDQLEEEAYVRYQLNAQDEDLVDYDYSAVKTEIENVNLQNLKEAEEKAKRSFRVAPEGASGSPLPLNLPDVDSMSPEERKQLEMMRYREGTGFYAGWRPGDIPRNEEERLQQSAYEKQWWGDKWGSLMSRLGEASAGTGLGKYR